MKKILSLVVALVMVLTVASALAAGSKGSGDIPSAKTDASGISIVIIPDGTEESNALILKYKEAFDAGDVLSALPDSVTGALPEGFTKINDILTAKFEGDTEKVEDETKFEINFTSPVNERDTVYVVFMKLDESRTDVFEATGTAAGSVELKAKPDQIKAYGNDPFVIMVISK